MAGLFLTPIALYHRSLDVLDTPKLVVLWSSGVVSVACWFVWSLERRRWPPRFRIGWAATGFAVAAGLSTVLSLSPTLSLLGLESRYGGLVPLLLYIGVMFAVVGLHWERPRRLAALLGAIGAASVIVAISVLLQQAGVDRTLWAGPVPGTLFDYPPGVVGFSNFAGAHLGLGLPCLSYLMLTTRRRLLRSLLGAAFAVDVVALWYTQSRGGMLAGVVGVAAMALADRERLGAWAKASLAGGAVLLLAAGLLFLAHPGRDTPPARLAGTQALRTKTLQFRLAYWQVAVHNLVDHPLVGTGPDTFYAAYLRYRPASDGASMDGRIRVDKPHNVILEHGSDSGLLGLVAYLSVVGLALVYGFRRCRQLAGSDRRLLAAFVGLLAGYLAQGLFSIDQPSLAVLGWVAIGGIATLADPTVVQARANAGVTPTGAPRVAPRSSNRPACCRRRARWAVHLLVLAVTGGLLVVGLRPLRADLAVRDGRFDEAIRLDPLNASIRVLAGDAAALAGDVATDRTVKRDLLTQGRRRYLEALRLQPRDPDMMMALARVETVWATSLDQGRFGEADAWWRRAMSADRRSQIIRQRYQQELPAAERRTVARLEADAKARPADASSRVGLTQTYLALGDISRARASLAEALQLDPANPTAQTLRAAIPPPPTGP